VPKISKCVHVCQSKAKVGRFLRHSVLYNRLSLFPLKIAPFHWESGPPSNTWFLGPCPVHDPNKQYLDQFSHFCRAYCCDRQNDRPTDYATRSVTVGHIYVHSTAMQSNNNNGEQIFSQFFRPCLQCLDTVG